MKTFKNILKPIADREWKKANFDMKTPKQRLKTWYWQTFWCVVGPFYPIQWWWSGQKKYPLWKLLGVVFLIEIDVILIFNILLGLFN